MSKSNSWTLRQCAFCSGYAHAACEAWDRERNEVCGRVVCDNHTFQSGRLHLCLTHRNGAPHCRPENKKTTQPALIELPLLYLPHEEN